MGGSGKSPQHVSLRPMYVKDDFIPSPYNPTDRNSLLTSPNKTEQIFFGDSFPKLNAPHSSFRSPTVYKPPKSLTADNYD